MTTIEELLTSPMENIQLHNKWDFYIYDKLEFKKMASKPGYNAVPYKKICTLETMNDIIYLLQLMKVKNTKDKNSNKLNLDMKDFILMREGIEPIWEDEKNKNGGSFTVKMNHDRGYETWASLVIYMVGETLVEKNAEINGLSVSYIVDNQKINSSGFTYLKIWDGKVGRTLNEFIASIPKQIYGMISTESLQYNQHQTRKGFNDKSLINKLNNNTNRGRGRHIKPQFIDRHRR